MALAYQAVLARQGWSLAGAQPMPMLAWPQSGFRISLPQSKSICVQTLWQIPQAGKYLISNHLMGGKIQPPGSCGSNGNDRKSFRRLRARNCRTRERGSLTAIHYLSTDDLRNILQRLPHVTNIGSG